jgi:hypothetical protein
MREDKRTRLRQVALRATLILPRHGQSTRGLQNVAAMRIVTLHTIHMPLNDGVMLREGELRVRIQMTLKTRLWILSGVDDELRGTTGANVFTPGAVAGFTTSLAGRCVHEMQP